MTGPDNSDPSKVQGGLPAERQNVPQVASEPARPYALDDRDKKLAIYVEARLEKRVMSIIRQESGDSYAGLPADHVLVNLDKQFPNVNFPERMMKRLEVEQDGRIAHEQRQDELDQYEAETRRTDAEKDRKVVNHAANRALLVLIILLSVGVLLTLLGHETAGVTVLGTTIVGVIASFLTQQIRSK